MIFHIFLLPFSRPRARPGAVLGAKLDPSWHPKGTPYSSKINDKNDVNSSGPSDPLGILIFRIFWNFDANLGAKTPPKSTQHLPKTMLMLKRLKNQKSCSRSCQGLIFKVRGASKSNKKLNFWLQKPIQKKIWARSPPKIDFFGFFWYFGGILPYKKVR